MFLLASQAVLDFFNGGRDSRNPPMKAHLRKQVPGFAAEEVIEVTLCRCLWCRALSTLFVNAEHLCE